MDNTAFNDFAELFRKLFEVLSELLEYLKEELGTLHAAAPLFD